MESTKNKAQYRPYERIEGDYARTIVVGDLHGCWNEFQQLLEYVAFSPEDILVTVGDFMDRGPGSWELARYFRDTLNAYSVLGNHERRIVGTVRGTSQPAWTQKLTLSLIDDNEHEQWASYLETLPAVIETAHAIIAHARLDPAVPVSDQEAYHTAGVGGPMVTIEKSSDDVPLWFKSMQVTKPVCIGHVSYDRVELVINELYALDTKACRGGCVTAVILPEGRVVQVRSQQDYYTGARTEWSRIRTGLDQSPLYWSLSHVLQMRNNGDPKDHDLQAALATVGSHLDSLKVSEIESSLHKVLKSIFGDIPPPGPERGEYYKNIKSVFPSRAHGAIIGGILSRNPLELKLLAHAFPACKVEDLGVELQSFSDILEEELRRTRSVRR